MTIDAGGLHCPNCGAAADPEARALPVLPRTSGDDQLPVTASRWCSRVPRSATTCGTCASQSLRPDHRRSTCPSDARGALERIDHRSRSRCSSVGACDGVWVGADCLRASVRQSATRRRRRPRSGLDASSPDRDSTAAPVRYRPCVDCGKMMNRVNFGRISGHGDRCLPRARRIPRQPENCTQIVIVHHGRADWIVRDSRDDWTRSATRSATGLRDLRMQHRPPAASLRTAESPMTRSSPIAFWRRSAGSLKDE